MKDHQENHEITESGQQKKITRRKALKQSALTLGFLYAAPATVDLLLSDRATAQSNVSVLVHSINNSSMNITLSYVDLNNVNRTQTIPPGGTYVATVLSGTDCTYAAGGLGFGGTLSIAGAVVSIYGCTNSYTLQEVAPFWEPILMTTIDGDGTCFAPGTSLSYP